MKSEKSFKQQNKEVFYASRFDFRFNNKYKISNAKVDEKGERIKTTNPTQVRIVSKNLIAQNPETFDSKGPRKSIAV